MQQCLQIKQVICLENNKYLIFLKDYKQIMTLFGSHYDCLISFEKKLEEMKIYIEKFKGN